MKEDTRLIIFVGIKNNEKILESRGGRIFLHFFSP